MNRALAVAVLVGGLLVGYAAGGSRIEAQGAFSANVPFGTGDTVRLRFDAEDRGGDTCIIEGFSGSFVICKSDKDLPFAFNLQKVIKATQIAKGPTVR